MVGNILFAQELDYRLPFVNSFSLQPILYNPAAKSEADLELNGNFHSYTGDFSDVNATYLSGLYNLNKPSKHHKKISQRAIGGLMLHETTSDFFKRTRIYGIYQESVNVSKEFWIRLGAQLGVVNFNLTSLGFGPGGSAWNYDAAVAINFGNKNMRGGFVIQQLANSELTPIVYTFVLNKYNELFASYRFELSPYLSYIPEIRYQQNINSDIYLFSNTFDFKKLAGINATLNVRNGASFLGYYKYENYQVFASYFLPIAAGLKEIDATQYELGVKIKINQKPEDHTTYWSLL